MGSSFVRPNITDILSRSEENSEFRVDYSEDFYIAITENTNMKKLKTYSFGLW